MFWIIALLVVVGIGLGAYGLWGPRARDTVRVPASPTVAAVDETAAETERWIDDADRSLADLSEAAKCDLMFAMGKLDNPRAKNLLARALNDPSEAVALAAAHALLSNGHAAVVEAYGADNPDRARRLLDTVALLG